MNAEETKPAQAAELVGDLFAKAQALPPPTPEELAKREAHREEASRRMIAESRLSDARKRYELACPTEFRSSDWTFPEIAPFLPQIERVLGYQMGPKGIIASGPTGRRKSGAMWALMERLTTEGRDVRFYSAFEFFANLQKQVSFSHDEAGGWIDAVARRPIVFIDDYGQQSLLKSREEWAQGWFFRFLDIRAGEHLPLFLTTNMTADAMAENGNMRGDPLIRRLLMVADPVPFETNAERSARAKRK